mgnify:CR=1 FL=1
MKKAGVAPGLRVFVDPARRAQIAVLHCTGTISKPLPDLAM